VSTACNGRIVDGGDELTQHLLRHNCCRYLFLLFDAAVANYESSGEHTITAEDAMRASKYTSPLRLDPATYIFSTEGHIFRSNIGLHKKPSIIKHKQKQVQKHVRGKRRSMKAIDSEDNDEHDHSTQMCEIHDEHNDATDDVMSSGSMLKDYPQPPRNRRAASSSTSNNAQQADIKLPKETADIINDIAHITQYHLACESFDDCQFVADPSSKVDVVFSWHGRAQSGSGRKLSLPASVAQFGLQFDAPGGEDLVPAGSVVVIANPADGCDVDVANAAEFKAAKMRLRKLHAATRAARHGASKSKRANPGIVAVVRRGSCTFSSKARVSCCCFGHLLCRMRASKIPFPFAEYATVGRHQCCGDQQCTGANKFSDGRRLW